MEHAARTIVVAATRPIYVSRYACHLSRVTGECFDGNRAGIAPQAASFRRRRCHRRPSAWMRRSLMILGTASHVGKSIIVTALCRVFRQSGLLVAPFKSQNMALNSFVCRDGSEIRRAQVAQAEAAGVEPESDMNPILLKPATDRKIQIVLHGRVYRTMTASEYYEQKPFFFKEALESFNRLAQRFDVVLIEGAGSAVELNLKDRDIVNLPFAKAAGSRAVLVADIDRGGVFASIVGTFTLLEDDERDLVRGFII